MDISVVDIFTRLNDVAFSIGFVEVQIEIAYVFGSKS